MHITETFHPGDEIPKTTVITFDGEARSGKGTSVGELRDAIKANGKTPLVIDQGKKFRALALVAIRRGGVIDYPDRLADFLKSDTAVIEMQVLLDEVNESIDQDVPEKVAFAELDDKAVGFASSRVGRIEHSHRIATDSLFAKVEASVASGVDTVIIDGRVVDQRGREIAERGLAQYVLGFFFRCDSGVAATRVLGELADPSELTDAQKLSIFDEMIKIRDRNRSDTLRDVNPMQHPHGAYELDLASFDIGDRPTVRQITLDSLSHGMISLNTSYTRTIAEMTVPVVAISTRAIALHDAERKKFMNDPGHWQGTLLFDDPRRPWTPDSPSSN